jgi:hypothetical protein
VPQLSNNNNANSLYIGLAEDCSKLKLEPSSLTKHAIILGATGSGKTVLSKVIVEEAAIHGIPTFAIDPKGDIGNLAFKSADFDFSRWSAKEADALGQDRTAYAQGLQKKYFEKMKEFSVESTIVSRFANGVTVRIFTPKSSAGLAAGISPDLSAPRDFDKLLIEDASSAAELLDLTSYGLLRLAGYNEDDREEITFVSAILEHAWKGGQSLTVQDIIGQIEHPKLRQIGSLSVHEMISDKDRKKLASRINLLVSDPKLRSWTIAEPLNFSEIFNGPSINVLDLRNIQSESEKQLFVELTLQQLYRWIIKQGSAQTLRYLLYFDEIAGYCPPVREPASKKLLLLLIKQARAFGLGLLLASQNAIDLDYKVISNANVRFIGRLGAKRDIQRVSTGLELGSGAEQQISNLAPGEFFCNIFDPKFSSIVKVRWPLTYHRGPLESSEIADLMAEFRTKLDPGPKSGYNFEQDGEETTALAQNSECPNKDLDMDSLERQDRKREDKKIKEQAHHVRSINDNLSTARTESSLQDEEEYFLMLENKYRPENLSQFIQLGNNLRSLKVLSVESFEKYHPIFEIKASIFEKKYSKQSLDKIVEYAGFEEEKGKNLIPIPEEHSIVSSRYVPEETRSGTELWKGQIQNVIGTIKDELEKKFDIIVQEKRNENVDARSEKLRTKLEGIKGRIVRLQEQINADIDTLKGYEKLYSELKKSKWKEKKKKHTSKSRIISVENKIETKRQKITLTRRKIEQLHTDIDAIRAKLKDIEDNEQAKFNIALQNIKSETDYRVSGWLAETIYKATILVNDNKEHYGDVQWSSYSSKGTWGRCLSCAIAIDSGSACSCGNLLCNNHLAYCKICLEPACQEHRSTCHICNAIFCSNHSIKCEICNSFACTTHSAMCGLCSRQVCNRCFQRKGLIRREIVCNACNVNGN